MKAFCASQSSDFASLFRRALSVKRTQHNFPQKLFFCRAKFDESSVSVSLDSTALPPTLLAAEKAEANSVLTLFLKKQGLSKAVVTRTVNQSNLFVDHLISRLHYVHKSRYLVGRELTTLEIRDTLIPYLESLLEEHGNVLVDLVENFPNAPVKEKLAVPVSQPYPAFISKKPKVVSNASVQERTAVSVSKKPKAVSQGTEAGQTGDLCPQLLYLIELGMNLEQIKVITRRYPDFTYCSLEGKIKPLVQFLLDLGVPKSNIPKILSQRPQLCSISLSDNLIPTMTFLEDLGVDKNQWAKVIYRFPGLLTHSRQKVQAIVNFLSELGLSVESVGKVLTRWPKIVGYSVEENLRPTVEYFRSLGVDVAVLLRRSPLTLAHSLEGNLKPVTQFFLGRGYIVEEVATMITRYPALYTCSLAENLIPKWDFFLTMGYPKLELVKFPQYFSYSLEERIRPRYARVKGCGVKMLLNQILSLSGCDFEKVLEMKMEKMLCDKGASDDILSQD